MADYVRSASSNRQAPVFPMEPVREGGTLAYSPLENRTFKNRDRATIIADILGCLVRNPRGKRKTNIRQSANLSSYMSEKYLDLLVRNGFIKVEEQGLYKPTTKGLKLLQNLDIQYLRMTITL